MSDSVQPHRRQPTRLLRPWDSPGKNTGGGCHCLLQCMKVKSESKSLSRVRLLVTVWTIAYQAPLSMGFSRQKLWSGLPLPSPIVTLTIYIFILIVAILKYYDFLNWINLHKYILDHQKYTILCHYHRNYNLMRKTNKQLR